MRWLPCPSAPFQRVHLPLCDSSAERLMRLLLRDAEDGRAEAVQMLRVDPSLTLWACLRFRSCPEDVTAPTFEHLADQLINRLAGLFEWPDESSSGECDAGAWAVDLAVDSVRHAVRSSAQCASQNAADLDREYLNGLMLNTPKWLTEGEGHHRIELTNELPIWLQSIVATNAHEKLPSSQAAIASEEVEEAARQWWKRRIPLCDTLPEFCQRLSRLDALERHFSEELEEQKLQAMYKLAAGAGHEINNPLGSIAGRAQLLLRDETDPDRRRALAKINSQAFRAHEMIADMMLFAKPPSPHLDRCDLVDLAQQVQAELCDEVTERHTELSCHSIESSVMVNGDKTQLMVALHAMCRNSLEALGSGGHIQVLISACEDDEQRRAEITVRDNGPGIPPAQRQHLFDPFFSGREAGRGLGFGLSKSWRIIENHGGKIRVESEPGRGAAFTISLPAA